VKWLVDLALVLEGECGYPDDLQTILADKSHPAHETILRKLVKRGFEALDEREPIAAFLAELREPEAERRAEVGRKLTKRARKALLGRMPSGPLIISLKDASWSTPLELQFGDAQEPSTEVKEERSVFPWAGPPRLKLSPLPDTPRSASLGLTLGNICFNI
jgi:hypothetical protein